MKSGLIEKVKKGAAVVGLASVLSLPGCAFRQGDERVSFFSLPFIPVASVTHEKFKDSESNEAVSKQEITVSSWFGNAYIDIKNYENGKYLGMQKIKIENKGGEYRAYTEIYDANNKMIERREGFPGDLPEGVKLNIRR